MDQRRGCSRNRSQRFVASATVRRKVGKDFEIFDKRKDVDIGGLGRGVASTSREARSYRQKCARSLGKTSMGL